MSITIIIPNFNGKKTLQQNLPQVVNALSYYIKTTKNKGELLIIDDCSGDNSVDLIDKFIKNNHEIEIRLIVNKNNYGFSTTINTGVDLAIGEVIVLLNSDVSPDVDFLSPLIKNFTSESVFGVGCMDKSIEETGVVLRGRGLGVWNKGFLQHRRGEVTDRDTLWVSGGSSAFRKKIWNKLGGLYPIYNPFYWEDIDISYRALKAGYTLLFEPKSVVTHSHNSGSIKTHFTKFTIKTITYKNQFIFSWINMTDINLFAIHIFWLPLHLIRAILQKDIPLIIGFLRALCSLHELFKYRKLTQEAVIKSDYDVINSLKL